MIQGKNIGLMLEQKQILKSVCFTIADEKITVFIGKSGAGKSTILRILAGLETSYEGSLLYNGQDIKNSTHQDRARMIGYVTQNYSLFPHLTVMQNCLLALQKVMRLSYAQAQQKAHEKLVIVGMDQYADVYPSKLSGGQRQRVAIARALCIEPAILILDEPTSALDPENTGNVVSLLKELVAQGITVVLSSQDVSFIKMVFDTVYLVDNGTVIESLDRQQVASKNESCIKTFLSL